MPSPKTETPGQWVIITNEAGTYTIRVLDDANEVEAFRVFEEIRGHCPHVMARAVLLDPTREAAAN